MKSFFKSFFGVICTVLAGLLGSLFLIVLLAADGDPSSILIVALILLLPAGLFLFLGILLFKGSKKTAIPNYLGPTGPRPYPEQRQRPGSPSPRASSPSSTPIDFDPEAVKGAAEFMSSLFGGQQTVVTVSTPAPKEPVSLDCPGCGSKTVVYPDKPATCEYCGTVIPYKD
ncbi:hypothetical protein [Paenibacillus sp. TH7-28]